MAIPKPEPSDWQKANAQVLRATDREVLAMLRDSYGTVQRELRALIASEATNLSAGIRRAQLEASRSRLMAEQAKVFERLGDIVSARRLRAASRAAQLSVAADSALLKLVGKGETAQILYDAALNASSRAIEVAMARLGGPRAPLSQRIYQTRLWMDGRLGRLINATLASGLNAKTFAKTARDWFNPSTPGGVRYAALRLARTEINNAFHAISVQKAADKPWVDEMDWNLSKSHPKPDKCNVLADASPYPADNVPMRPHPQCMCYVTERTPDEDGWTDRFLEGEFDDYLDSELEKAGVTSEPEGDTNKAAVTPRNVKKGMEIRDRDGNWHVVDGITKAPGGGSRTGGGRGGQWTFRDAAGEKILSAAPNENVQVRRASGKAVAAEIQKPHPSPKLDGLYGDRLHLNADSGEIAKTHLTDLEKIPDNFHAKVKRLLSKKESGGIFIGDKAVPELSPESGYLRGVQPRGWREGDTWDKVPGAFSRLHSQLLLGGGEGHSHGSTSLANHEFAHALWDSLLPDDRKEFRVLYYRLHGTVAVNPYLNSQGNPDGFLEEGFAETFAGWTKGKDEPRPTPAFKASLFTIKKALGVRHPTDASVPVANSIINQMIQLFEGWADEFR